MSKPDTCNWCGNQIAENEGDCRCRDKSSDKAVREGNCQSWLIFCGEEYKCQWKEDHLGCHSAWSSKGKLKWERTEKDKQIAELKAELISRTEWQGYINNAQDKAAHEVIDNLKAEKEALYQEYQEYRGYYEEGLERIKKLETILNAAKKFLAIGPSYRPEMNGWVNQFVRIQHELKEALTKNENAG